MSRELRAWGVRADRGTWHHKFIGHALQVVETCHNLRHFPKNTEPKMLPRKGEEAIEVVFRNEIQGMSEERCRFHEDSIVGSTPFSTPPYLVFPDKYNPSKFFVKVKREYDRLGPDDFDPQNRFSFVKVSKREFFAIKFGRRSTESLAYEGNVFEALVVSHAIHSEQACFCCKFRKCLRWNGGIDSPWTDMECINCDSCYEIKSKRDMEAIEKGHESIVPGGSYRDFFRLHAQKRKPGWKHYLVEVSRMTSYAKMPELGEGMHLCHVIHIAEIDRVLPRLKPNCFADGKDMMPRSGILTKTSSKPWFRVPHLEVDHMAIYARVLEEEFPGILAEVEASQAQEVSKEAVTESLTNGPTCAEEEGSVLNDVDALRQALHDEEELSDWEDGVDEE